MQLRPHLPVYTMATTTQQITTSYHFCFEDTEAICALGLDPSKTVARFDKATDDLEKTDEAGVDLFVISDGSTSYVLSNASASKVSCPTFKTLSSLPEDHARVHSDWGEDVDMNTFRFGENPPTLADVVIWDRLSKLKSWTVSVMNGEATKDSLTVKTSIPSGEKMPAPAPTAGSSREELEDGAIRYLASLIQVRSKWKELEEKRAAEDEAWEWDESAWLTAQDDRGTHGVSDGVVIHWGIM